ncbi:MAG: site-specific DNA-methyltransferase [Bacteroidaceae bacterium]|nr:site-specific DNA-methyltransferase [Bacteroidaceae bacterium]
MIVPYYKSDDKQFTLLKGDCIKLLNSFDFKFDMIFADPPYHLSNGGLSIQSGKLVCVNKGDWDKSQGAAKDYEFDKEWLTACKNKLKANGTIWVSGTYHNIFSIARCLTELEFKILNCVTWVKTNPPPNFSCRYFTHSAEYIIWAKKNASIPHYFNYELMKDINGGKQMRDVWNLPAIARWEKSCGKHPTQKPLCVLSRIIQASTPKGAWILDPFTGSSTTGIAANLLERRFLGIDKEEVYLQLSQKRKEEIKEFAKQNEYLGKLQRQARLFSTTKYKNIVSENEAEYATELPF